MKMKKLVALTMVTLLALMLVPLAASSLASNQWTPTTVLPQQVNTPPKAITTEPLGNYLKGGDNITIDATVLELGIFPTPYIDIDSAQLLFAFEYNDTRWGDWFIVNVGGMYFAIDNTTREIGLNGTEPFYTQPANDSVITRLTDVYSFLAIPTGIEAGDKIKVMILAVEFGFEQVTCEVLGRITTPIFGPAMDLYDTWMLHGNWKNASLSLAPQYAFDTESGILISSTTAGSIIFPVPYDGGLFGFSFMMQFNRTASDINNTDTLAPLENAGIDDYTSAEGDTLLGETFTYNESGYWYIDWSTLTGGAVGKVTLNSLEGSYMNFTLTTDFSWDLWLGISQTVKIPDSLWNYFGTWDPTYYNSSTRTGHIEAWDIWTEIEDLFRFDSSRGPIWSMFLAPPWIRDGATIAVEMILPMFFVVDNSTAGFGPIGGVPYALPLPFRVTGAVPVVIDGNVYDCWKAELLLPTDLSDVNLTQFRAELYFERTSGVLVKAKADMEAKMPAVDGDGTSIGYHKTWTLADSSVMILPVSIKALPTPEEMSSYYNAYYLYDIPADQWWTLDPSLFNGGSVTVRCNDTVSIAMCTQTQMGSNYTIDGKPVVKFMIVDYQGPLYPDFNGSVNFCYTPSELWAMGARESGFSIYAWNGTAWELLNTTWDAEGRIVYANTTHFSVFALVASPLTIWDILGPGGTLILLNLLIGQAAGPPLGGLLLPLAALGIGLLILALIAAVILRKPK
ncbi:MAG: hypothetical protein ACETWM_08365 [Candidatus Lokiarchaeia archaeon]